MANVKKISYVSGSTETKALADYSTTAINGVYYGTCTTAAGTAAKVSSDVKAVGEDIPTGGSSVFALKTGTVVNIKFTNSNTASDPTLQINSTTAKAIKRYGTTAPSTSAASSWQAGAVVPFVYDGTYWVEASSFDANTTYNGMVSGYCSTKASTQTKSVTSTNTGTPKEGMITQVAFTNANTYNGLLKMTMGGVTTDLYIDGVVSSSSNKTIEIGTYTVIYHTVGGSLHFDLIKSDIFLSASQKAAVTNITDTIEEDSEALITSGGVYDAIDSLEITENQVTNLVSDLNNIREVAQGKTASYVVDDTVDTAFNSQNDTITITSNFYDVNKGMIPLNTLNIGDTTLVTQIDVPDRWVQTINYTGISKGDLINLNLDGTEREYRVLKHVRDNVYELVAMFDLSTTFTFGSNNTYNGSNLDVYLNETWYNTLTETARHAIVDKTITQYCYEENTSVYNNTTHASRADYSTKTAKESNMIRHVYALDVEDIELYFNQVFSMQDIWTLFWKRTIRPTTTLSYPLLRSAKLNNTSNIWNVSGYDGGIYLGTVSSETKAARPAFQIDLTAYNYDAHVSSVILSKLETAKVPITSISLNSSTITPVNGNVDITAVSSVKSLKTDNTTAQSTSSSETISGSGTINLHKVSKTGSYSDLLNKPTLGTAAAKGYTTTAVDGATDLITSGGVASALTPVLKGYSTIAADGTLTFNLTSSSPQDISGLAILTFGNTMTIVNLYGMQNETIYKTSGTFVYDSGGSVVTTTMNYKINYSTRKLTFWSGNSNYNFVSGFTAYLFLLKLYGADE